MLHILLDVYKQNYSVHKGTMKNATQKVRIYRRQFPNDAQSKERFRVLMAAFNQGIVLADNIFLSYENNCKDEYSFDDLKVFLAYYLYIVEPWFKRSNSKFVPLSHVLQTNISNAKKHRLFQNLVIIVKSLHELGIYLIMIYVEYFKARHIWDSVQKIFGLKMNFKFI